MDFKVFLSYTVAPEEQALVWRLQTLATAEGIEMYVPPRTSVHPASARNPPVPPAQVRKQIDDSDFVLAILAGGLNAQVQQELSYALGKGKVIVPIVAAGSPHAAFFDRFTTFPYSPSSNVGEIETRVVEFLRQQVRNKAQRQAFGALVGIGLGLFLLSAAQKAK
jgi:hypothetical protein